VSIASILIVVASVAVTVLAALFALFRVGRARRMDRALQRRVSDRSRMETIRERSIELRSVDGEVHVAGAYLESASAIVRREIIDAMNRGQGRSLQVDVQCREDGSSEVALTAAFVAGRSHRLSVWIGHQRDARPTTISSATLFDEDLLTPDLGEHTRIMVTVAYLDTALSRVLWLPNDRTQSSQPCEFDVFVPADRRHVAVTIALSQGQRTLEQYVLLGNAVKSIDQAPFAPLTLERQVVARSFDDPGPSSPFDASLVVPKDGAPAVKLQDGLARVVAPWDDAIRKTVDDVAEGLFDAARSAAAGAEAEAWSDLLRLLVNQGGLLLSWLEDHGMGGLVAAERIQLIEADATKTLPIEIVYQGGPVTDDAVACPQWREALRQGACASCMKGNASASPYICPLGFWGLSKLVERQTGSNEPPRLRPLHPLRSVLFAASDQVLEQDYQDTIATLTDVVGVKPPIAQTWEEWRDLVSTHDPTLIVLLPHQGYDTLAKLDYLEIGRASRLKAGQVKRELVGRAGGPEPIVLLLGCGTADGKVKYRSFAADFRSRGAHIVVGTIASVLGRDAAPIAQQFVRELARIGRARVDGAPTEFMRFDETMLAVRRRMALEGNVAALALVAFGDSDWRMEIPAGV
jgi:hypothetical protein